MTRDTTGAPAGARARATETPTPEERAADNADKLQALHDRLLDAVHDLTSAEGWQRMLRTAAALPTYSPHNVLLITSQRPDVTAVAGFGTWKQLGRSVRKGEKGIAILAPVLRRTPTDARTVPGGPDRPGDLGGHGESGDKPGESTGVNSIGGPGPRRVSGFRVVHVFDLSQTDGPEICPPPDAVRLEGRAPDGLIDGLTAQVHAAGYQFVRHAFDVPHPGMARANGVTDYFARTVVVRPDLSDAQTAKTLAHELGHVLLHNPTDRPSGLTREQAEVEAESVAYIVTAAHGLDSAQYTVPYVAGWAGADLTLVARTAERVLTTSRSILTATPAPPAVTLDPAARAQHRDQQRDQHRSHDRAGLDGPAREAVTATRADQGRAPAARSAERPARRGLQPPTRTTGGARTDQGRLW